MPIEIKELHIKTVINQKGGTENRVPDENTSDTGGQFDREEIVSECIEKILEILKNKRER